ncbi:MAG: adenylate/guanylate cyclase domain-containing protein [Pirellulaceae bacterium]
MASEQREQLMSQPVQIQVVLANGNAQRVEWDSGMPLVIGRQENPNEPLLTFHDCGDHVRMAIASHEQIDVSRHQIQLTKLENRKVLVTNLSPQARLIINDDVELNTDRPAFECVLPTEIKTGEYGLRLENAFQTLSRQTQFHTQIPGFEEKPVSAVLSQFTESDAGELVGFVSRVTSVLQQSMSEADLYQSACDSVKSLIDVDAVAIVLGNRWEHQFGDTSFLPDVEVLDQTRRERRVVWGRSTAATQKPGSDGPAEYSFISAPLVTERDDRQTVIGALYAYRDESIQGSGTLQVNELQAQLIELVACAVASGYARIQQEKTSARFQQFFAPELAKKLIHSDELLQASQRDVTVLFCDIRNFSLISEDIGPQETSRWVQDVLTKLSDCVLKHEGVLVDYIGDELMAMWGAPDDQPDHASLACHAAIEMINTLPALNAYWQPLINAETSVGIGINSGPANVGNTGSTQKFKYGPLGDTVNRASRVQSLTKSLNLHILITGQTRNSLPENCAVRRIGRARVVNIEEVIELFELQTGNATPQSRTDQFEEALAHLESGDLVEAAELLVSSLDFRQPDRPALLMASEIIKRLVTGNSRERYEWEFDKK